MNHIIKTIFILMNVFILSEMIAQENKMKYNLLTPEEENVIIHKSTERPFSGKYDKHFSRGIYTCKRCSAQLYKSDDKFDSSCGWPSFDDEISDAVKRIPDKDGHRTEIICANCNAHLGHVFLDEGFTDKDTRHCVNSISLNFIPVENHNTEKAYFAGGCFWGVEHFFLNRKGVLSTNVGYTGGYKANPTYEEVCSGISGHVEAIEVSFDPSIVSYEKLAKFFFEIHDPTQIDRQGPDIGEQYQSVIFYNNDEQKVIAEKLIKILINKGYSIATNLIKSTTFWTAEDYHQEYYKKNGKLPYCHVYQKRF